MREIKFKVWCKDSLQWVNDNTRYNIFRGELNLGSGDPWVFLQYTGLKDKNGKEIYEGDILNFSHLNYSVYWRDYEWVATCPYYHKYHWPTITPFRNVESGEIIGNIFENPELLKK